MTGRIIEIVMNRRHVCSVFSSRPYRHYLRFGIYPGFEYFLRLNGFPSPYIFCFLYFYTIINDLKIDFFLGYTAYHDGVVTGIFHLPSKPAPHG